jgi:hypothetical protein
MKMKMKLNSNYSKIKLPTDKSLINLTNFNSPQLSKHQILMSNTTQKISSKNHYLNQNQNDENNKINLKELKETKELKGKDKEKDKDKDKDEDKDESFNINFNINSNNHKNHKNKNSKDKDIDIDINIDMDNISHLLEKPHNVVKKFYCLIK